MTKHEEREGFRGAFAATVVLACTAVLSLGGCMATTPDGRQAYDWAGLAERLAAVSEALAAISASSQGLSSSAYQPAFQPVPSYVQPEHSASRRRVNPTEPAIDQATRPKRVPGTCKDETGKHVPRHLYPFECGQMYSYPRF